jgi:hypothetical protein
MNTTVKWILIVCLSLFVLCGCGWVGIFTLLRASGTVIASSIETDVQTVAAVGGDIATYDLPDGFGSAFSVQLGGFSMISHTGFDQHSHIYFFRIPPNVHIDEAGIESKLRSSGWVQYPVRYTLVDQQVGMICGQETTLVTSEGVNGEGQGYRQMSAAFTTRDGAGAYVIISMPLETWDQDVVDGFFASIR